MQIRPEPSAATGIVWESYEEHPSLWPIALRLPALPGQRFVLFFPECFTARESESVNFWQHKPLWTFQASQARAVATADAYAYELTIRYCPTAAQPALEWEYVFENRSAGTHHDLAAFNCLFLSQAPLFKDVEMTRTWVLDDAGRPVRLDSVPKTKSPRTLQFYGVAGGPDLAASPWPAGMQATCKHRLAGDSMWVISTDGRWRLETKVDGPTAYFFNNWESDHGCIHAAPLLGTLPPGAKATARGSIRFIPI